MGLQVKMSHMRSKKSERHLVEILAINRRRYWGALLGPVGFLAGGPIGDMVGGILGGIGGAVRRRGGLQAPVPFGIPKKNGWTCLQFALITRGNPQPRRMVTERTF